MRKTKIVCTLGPATDNPQLLRELMQAGMNVARINFSHGNYQDQEERINLFKSIRKDLGLPIPLLLDTQGPEIRIERFENGRVLLKDGQIFILKNQDILGNENQVSITYKKLYRDIEIGSTILVNDGTIELKVDKIVDKDIVCKVIQGGELTNRKSMNIPNLILNLPIITKKDIADIKYGISAGFDYIAASFVRKKEDVLAIKKVLKENSGENVKVISKIENREGISNFDEILEVSDGIMVARGDLGVEIPMEEVPIYQKQFIKKCYRTGKPIITATQMLESMLTNSKPTRAEISDIANAIYDGSSAIMLSGETATGKYPVKCVKVMDKVAQRIEKSLNYWERFKNRKYNLENSDYNFSMNYSICICAENMKAKAIIAYTDTGNTSRTISSFGPECPIFAITENERTYRQLGLCWNIIPMLFPYQKSINKLVHLGIDTLKNTNVLQKGDTILIAGGSKVIRDLEDNETEINKLMGGVVKL